jgi:antitoxin component of RelBE/YafQ-DinJ toxin-antitoxin module
MESKTARLTVLIDPQKKQALEQVCAEQDVTPSQVVRRLIRDYIAQHSASKEAAPARHAGGRRSR